MNQMIEEFLNQNRGEIEALAHEIFDYAEIAEQEVKSSCAVARFLERQGFQVTKGIGGMPTAIRAQWGNGRPMIGFLGEYDALPELNQPAKPYYCGDPSRNGHGCGHNLLGVGSAAAAAALAAAMKLQQINGTVLYYGCPAEEILKGKVVMLKNGCFQELDAAITWHPGMENRCGELSYLAMDSIQFFFEGQAAHASAAPFKGRSALDACELMNVGSNYLREHVTDDVRIHYSYLPNSLKPNIVPAAAGVWYFIRARRRDTVNDVTKRVMDIAKGAALMTSTQVRWEFLSRGYETLINFRLCRLMHDVMTELGHPGFHTREIEFARALVNDPVEKKDEDVLDTAFDEPSGQAVYMTGSTDVSDVSQVTPTVSIRIACGPKNIALHSWQYTACSDSDIGRKGMLFAAHIMAEGGWRLMTDSELLNQVQKEFRENASEFKNLM